jgi:hypothetical protein
MTWLTVAANDSEEATESRVPSGLIEVITSSLAVAIMTWLTVAANDSEEATESRVPSGLIEVITSKVLQSPSLLG